MMNVIRGLLIGLANLVPGISGATMAVILGVYDELIASISKLVKFKLKREDSLFMLTIGIGIITAIFIGSAGMSFLLARFPALAYSTFFGLVLGSIPKLYKEIEKLKLLYFVSGILLMITLELTSRAVRLSGTYLILSGFVAACAMILPGLSGSLVLLIFGIYDDIVSAVARIEFSIIIPFSAGVIAGIAVMSLIMNWLSEEFPKQTKSFTFGLIIASLLKIEPFTKESLGFTKLIFILLMITIFGYISFKFSQSSHASAR